MDLWFMIKERTGFLSFFLVIILLCVFLLIATWKNRTNIPKSLTAILALISTVFIVVSLIAMIFLNSFGYNS